MILIFCCCRLKILESTCVEHLILLEKHLPGLLSEFKVCMIRSSNGYIRGKEHGGFRDKVPWWGLGEEPPDSVVV